MKLLLVAAYLGLSVSILTAQAPAVTNKLAKAATEKHETSDKKPNAGPFHARLVAVDKVAHTITVGKRTFQITAETKINKSGKPATLNEAVIGETVSGYVKPNGEGKLIATKLNLGPKVEEHSSKSNKKKS